MSAATEYASHRGAQRARPHCMSHLPSKPAPYEQRCSFCRAARAEVRSLIAGPSVSICDACARLAIQILLEETAEPAPHDAACSFCHKARAEVRVLIPGPAEHICDQCVQLCSQFLDEEGSLGGVSALPTARVRKKPWWQRFRGRG